VRQYDPDRYLPTLFLPAEAREALFALYAFDHEIGRVRHVVNQPMAGLIRLQWWREALDEIALGQPARAHPVAEALQRVTSGFTLSLERLQAAIDARERELDAEPPPSLDALERHLEATSSGITLAALEMLGATAARAIEVGRRAGLAWGLADTLRSIAADAGRGLVRLPDQVMRHHGVDAEALARGEPGGGLARLVGEIAGRARAHLREARSHRAAVPKPALPAVWPALLAEDYLKRLARAGHDPLGSVRSRPGTFAPLKLLVCRALGAF
jgi:NADH dehydrogenase [ubiquinone] 1 alpha subcomplex assembly factor 6